ncbi:MAG: hypothetical protein DRN20_06235, partial [Thermoplasmata archaeon]
GNDEQTYGQEVNDKISLMSKIPTIKVGEGRLVRIDLSRYFYDPTPESKMHFAIVTPEDCPILSIKDSTLEISAYKWPDWVGEIGCLVKAYDDNSCIYSNVFTISIQNINDPPEYKGDALLSAYVDSTIYLDLNTMFEDRDSALKYTVLSNHRVECTITSSILRIRAWIPGDYSILVSATDGEYTVVGRIVLHVMGVSLIKYPETVVLGRGEKVIDVQSMFTKNVEKIEVLAVPKGVYVKTSGSVITITGQGEGEITVRVYTDDNQAFNVGIVVKSIENNTNTLMMQYTAATALAIFAVLLSAYIKIKRRGLAP